ncbi:hypothetical protein AB4Z30_15505 [Paenibacillus sp. 2TAF8]|jgi:hypothetical protein|uniref:hypothetical protein n=1 Tax=Paenibacillus sp. 2TAF8 TaxID=3233020 RepID=UPI003F9E708F
MPNHQFVVEDQTVLKENLMDAYSWDSDGKVYKRGLGVVEQVVFEDEFISYIHDTLRWLDTWNPSTDTRNTGLNVHGITVIVGQDILLKFQQIIRSWIELLSLAPDPIVLTGNYCIDVTTGKGRDEKLVYDKTDLIDQLSKLAVMTKYAAETGRCIIHFGV